MPYFRNEDLSAEAAANFLRGGSNQSNIRDMGVRPANRDMREDYSEWNPDPTTGGIKRGLKLETLLSGSLSRPERRRLNGPVPDSPRAPRPLSAALGKRGRQLALAMLVIVLG